MNTRQIAGFASRSTLLVLIAALAAGLGMFTAQRYFAAAGTAPTVPSGQLKSVQLITPPRELAEIDADLKQCTDRILTMIKGLTA